MIVPQHPSGHPRIRGQETRRLQHGRRIDGVEIVNPFALTNRRRAWPTLRMASPPLTQQPCRTMTRRIRAILRELKAEGWG